MPDDRAASRPATLEEVAALAGVSRQTVSNALNAPTRLRPQTLQHVLRTIDDVGYRPNSAARALRSQVSRVIGFRLFPLASGSVLDRLLHAFCDAARGSGYDVLVFSATDDEDELALCEDLRRRRAVDAVVITGTHRGDGRPRRLAEYGVPFVAFGRPWGEPGAHHPWVDVDGARGTAEATAHLARLGHLRIAFLGLPRGDGPGDDRLQGWRRATRQLGLAHDGGLVQRGTDDLESGRRLAGALLSAAEPPTAFVCATDALAVGALWAIEDCGLRPGLDTSVIGFDDSPAAALVRPALSSVRQPIDAVALDLVGTVLARLGAAEDHHPHRLLAPRLVLRESSGPPRSRRGRAARTRTNRRAALVAGGTPPGGSGSVAVPDDGHRMARTSRVNAYPW